MFLLTCDPHQYDDLTAVEGGPVVPVPDGYNGLRWRTFSVNNPLVTLLPPRSPPNYIASSIRNQLLSGQTAGFDVDFSGSTTVSFTLRAFYFGCLLQTTVSVGNPIACTIAVKATNARSGASVGPVYRKFSPGTVGTGGLSTEAIAEMTQATFGPEFADVDDIRIEVEQDSVTGDGAQASSVLFLDNVEISRKSRS